MIEQQPQSWYRSPSTEILFALGLGDRVAGVTTYCDYPQEALSKPKIGGFSTPSVEKIIEAKPDLVLAGDMHQQAVAQLEAVNIKVLVFTPTSMQEIFSTISAIGKAAGEEESANTLVSGLQQRVDDITSRVAQAQTPGPEFYEMA